MLSAGEWWVCDDGVTRPVVAAQVQGADGTFHHERFLLDSGADRTVLSAALLSRAGLQQAAAPQGMALAGVGGTQGFVVVSTTLEFTRDDGGPATARGQFSAFTDPAATEMSVLGRDVLAHFDVILSRRRNEVLLLAPNHQYRLERV